MRVTCSCAWRERLRRKAPMKAPALTSTGSATSRSPVSLGESRYSDTKQPTVWVPLRRPWGRGHSGWGDHWACPGDGRAHLGDGRLTWEMASLKEDLNSWMSAVSRDTSCPVRVASKKATSCLPGERWVGVPVHPLLPSLIPARVT